MTARVGEEHADERERAGHLRGDARVGERLAQSVLEPLRRVRSELGVRVVVELGEHRETRRGRERVPGERARLVHGTERRELVHHVGAPADGREREPAADHLAEDREIGRDAEARLRAAERRRGSR